ncbi:MAG: hypothetical protein AB7U41_04315 [Dongiaceae bacterium]
MRKEKHTEKETESAAKYISFREIPPLAKTRRFYVQDKAGQPFAIIKWYGGWRKYVCFFQGDSFCDQSCLRIIARKLEELNREWRAAHKQPNRLQ